jgi:hypothetical protein
MTIPFPLITDDWIIPAYRVSTDGPFHLCLFDQEDGSWDLTWYDTRLNGYDNAYQTIYRGSKDDCLMALDILTRTVGLLDHSRSIIFMRHKARLPSNIRIPYVD